MRTPLQAISPRAKYKVDFALVPVTIVLIEFSVFLSQFFNDTEQNFINLLLLRFTHTILMFALALLVSFIFIKVKKVEVPYLALAIVGTIFIAFGDLTHVLLASFFNIELISFDRRLGILLIEGLIWFPAFIIVAGNRVAIFQSFKDYERRLISAARARSRNSQQFKDVQIGIQNQIKRDLFAQCSLLREAISSRSRQDRSLNEIYRGLTGVLLGEDLRKLSISLETPEITGSNAGSFRKRINSISIFYQQFRILYSTAVRTSPLPRGAYLSILLGLITPLYLYFYSPREMSLVFPLLFALTLLLTSVVRKLHTLGSVNSLRFASALIFMTGLLPLPLNHLDNQVLGSSDSHIPAFITACVFPITYYIFMELFQVLRPTALKLLQSDGLSAGLALQNRVSIQVQEEFSSNLSHQWAIFIHGKILTRLAATALKLMAAAEADDPKSFQEATDSLSLLLQKPDADFGSERKNLQEEVAARLDPWKGLLDINLYIDEELKGLNTLRVRDLGEVIEELISNSIRHGKSKNIELRVMRSGDNDVEVFSVDDAIISPPESPQRSGLGTRIFNLASDGRWTLTRRASATEFRLTMGIMS